MAESDRKSMPPLVIGAIGIVFGDIGTSPLYTLRECFTGAHGLPLAPENIFGILSIVFWAIMIIVTLKYVTLIMRADNRGEGGIMALTALVSGGVHDKRARWWLVGLGIFGAAMFYGDGMITPRSRYCPRSKASRSLRPPCRLTSYLQRSRSWSVCFLFSGWGRQRSAYSSGRSCVCGSPRLRHSVRCSSWTIRQSWPRSTPSMHSGS